AVKTQANQESGVRRKTSNDVKAHSGTNPKWYKMCFNKQAGPPNCQMQVSEGDLSGYDHPCRQHICFVISDIAQITPKDSECCGFVPNCP
ncbi:MAG: hypothetical protein ACYSTS_09685, partial [Planctomycetota bacterium]